MAERKRSPRAGSGGSTGCLVWLLLICGVFLLFLLNWGKIQETLRTTNFTEVVRTLKEAEGEKPSSPVAPAPKVEEPLPASPGPGSEPRSTEGLSVIEPQAEKESLPTAQPPSPGAEKPPASNPAPQAPVASRRNGTSEPAPPSALPPARTRSALLYFVRIDDDGVIVRQEVKRAVPASDSPLADSLAALLRGPSEEELRKSLVSLIPNGTVLLSVRIRGSTAELNFSEAFMYNHYGIEGYAGQLKQVVYTATAFPSVHDVQILIEGERHDYLGGEGVFIGRPLSRNSF